MGLLSRNNGNGLNGHLSVASPSGVHGQLQPSNADESSLQSNSNSEDFSDEGVDPSRGLVKLSDKNNESKKIFKL